MAGVAITVDTDAFPLVSEFYWEVDGENFSTSDSISLGEDMIGEVVNITCLVFNVMIGDVQGNDTASCLYTVQGIALHLLRPVRSPISGNGEFRISLYILICILRGDFVNISYQT